MLKEKFIKSTIILIIGGFITKIMGMLIRVVMTRTVGLEGTSLYMLILPTFSLFVAISQLGFPVAISKLVAEDRYNNKNIMFSTITVSIILNVVLMLIVLLLAPFLANNLLHNKDAYLPIVAISLVLPFDSMSSILRGYFFGKQRMIPHVISNILEQIVRITIMIFLVPNFLVYSVKITVTVLVLINVISELSASLVLFFFLPKNFKIKKEDLKPSKQNIVNVLDIALPTTGGRLIGSIGYFFEPIILTLTLIKVGYSSNYIMTEYGIITGYVMPLLLLPGFFTAAISSALIPVVSKGYVNKNYNYVKRKLKQAIIISLAIGIPVTVILMIFPKIFLKLIYNTDHGSTYLRTIAPVFLLYYIQSPLSSILQSIGKAKEMMFDNLKGIIVKTALIFILSLFKIGLFGLLIGTSINIIIVTISHYLNVKKALN